MDGRSQVIRCLFQLNRQMALLRRGCGQQAWLEDQLPQNRNPRSQELNNHPADVPMEKVDQSPVGSLDAHRLGLDPESGEHLSVLTLPSVSKPARTCGPEPGPAFPRSPPASLPWASMVAGPACSPGSLPPGLMALAEGGRPPSCQSGGAPQSSSWLEQGGWASSRAGLSGPSQRRGRRGLPDSSPTELGPFAC